MSARGRLFALGTTVVAVVIAGGSRGVPAGAAPPPTWTTDIAPFVAKHCVSCHRPEGGAPFSFDSYEDVARRARLAADLVERGRMPPWLPTQGADTFLDARLVSTSERRRFREWVDAGLPRGEGLEAASVHVGPPPAWELGPPDLVATSGDAFPLAPEGADVYRALVIPVRVPERRYVSALEFRTDAPTVVHHAVIGLDRTGTARWLDNRDAGAGFDGRLTGPTQGPDGHFLGWTPGRRPTVLPPDLAWTLDPGTDLVVQLHLVPSGRPEQVGVRVGLHFSETPPRRRPVLVRTGSMRIDIPPGASRYVTRDELDLPVDVEALAVQPHAHLRATRVEAVATAPDGVRRDLLRIDRWDFSWQDEYRYVTPRALPRGTRISTAFTFDNTPEAPANGGAPPPRVLYGPRTSDEMGDVWIQVLTRTPGDRAELVRALAVRDREAGLDAYTRLVKARPLEAEHQLTLGLLLGLAGRGEEAIARYREAMRLSPGDVLPKYNLAVGWQAVGRHDRAEPLLRDVVAADPLHAEAWHALAHVAIAAGRSDEAQERLARALTIWPGFADARVTLGTVLARAGRPAEAEHEFRLALVANPDQLAALNNLGILLAGRGAVGEAIRLLEHALEVDPTHAPSRQNLTAARELGRGRD